jgi:hypothetical protein
MSLCEELDLMARDMAELEKAFERVTSDPRLCGRFLVICSILKGLERRARDSAVKFALDGHDVPGCEFNEGRTQSSVDAKAILEIAHSDSPKRLLANLLAFVHLVAPVSGAIYRAFCKKIGAVPRAEHIDVSQGVPFVVCRSGGLPPFSSRKTFYSP